MKVTLNRQKLGVEDLEIGLGTVSQTRGGETVIITKIGLESLLATANVVVNTLPAGSDATVEISGADLIFGIPEGDTGESLTMTSVVDNLDGTFTWHFSNSTSFTTPNLIGLPGKSTYEVAVDGGFVGTEADWLLYLEATSRVGNAIGNTDGNTTGNTDGNTTGNTDGNTTGNTVGNTTGNTVGNTIGNTDGNTTGNTVGNTIGNTDGNTTGNTVGNTTGNTVGNTIGNTPAHIWDGTSLSFSTNDAKDEFGSSVDLVGPAGNGIVSVIRTAGTGAAGTIDTYTITYSDTTTSTFNVYNGADGLGSGDMVKSIYDPTNINASVFDTDNHISGTTNKVYTATEQTKLSGIAESADVTSANETSHADVLVDADIGSTVQGYDANTTLQGNTFNGVGQLVQTDGTGKLPAIDGSLLTGLSSGVTDHTLLTNIGTKTHAQLESDIAGKQATLTFDSTPTDGSTNPVTSNGIFNALATKVGTNLAVALNTARATVASHATAAQIWTALGNQINWTETATTTIFPNAPQAGAERTLICAGACRFTAGANMLIDGVTSGVTVTCASGDTVIVRAISTTQFKLTRLKADGTPQVSPLGMISNYQEFTTSGTWTKPVGATCVYVEAIGGGAGGCTNTGGGGGGFSAKLLLASTITSTVTVTIGAGGTTSATTNSVNAGGNTTFGAYSTANGGVGGSIYTPSGGRIGTQAGGGEYYYQSGISNIPAAGGYSSGAGAYNDCIGGSCVMGGAGGAGGGTTSRQGGVSTYGGNGGSNNTAGAGGNGIAPGGGGGAGTTTGGIGAAGRVRIWAW